MVEELWQVTPPVMITSRTPPKVVLDRIWDPSNEILILRKHFIQSQRLEVTIWTNEFSLSLH